MVDDDDAVAEPDELLGELERTRARKRRFRHQLALTWLCIGAAWLTYAWLPGWLADEAESQANECFDGLTAEDDPARCRQGALLWLPGVLPGHRGRAAELEESITERITVRQRNRAARVTLDRRAWEAAERALGDEGTLQDRLVAGDLDGATELARDVTEDSSQLLAAGALLCLRGDRAAGLDKLVAADRDYRRQVHSPWPVARVAIHACAAGDPPVDPWQGPSYGWNAVAAVDLGDPARFPGRRLALADRVFEDLRFTDGIAAVALLLEHPEADVERLFEAIDSGGVRPRAGASGAFVSTWWILSAHTEVVEVGTAPLPPELFERAGERLEVMAAKVSGPLPGDPEAYVPPALEAMRREPRATLTALAWHARTRAAVLYAHAGRRADALRNIRSAELRAPDQPALSGALRLATGDADGAVRALEVAPADEDAASRAIRLRELALARAAQGAFDEAFAAAGDAVEAAEQTEPPHRVHLVASTRWVHAAMALRTGNRIPWHADTGAIVPEGAEDLDGWLRLAAAPPAAQRRERLSAPEVYYLDRLSQDAVLPAVLYVIGRAAGDGDVEVWLDVIVQRAPQQRHMMLARAEAARWRGDADAAEVWQLRAKAWFPDSNRHRDNILALAMGF